MKNGKIIILSGPSGSGKTTISKYLLSKNFNIRLSISCTTRKIRKYEKNGKDYYFISNKDFFYKIKTYQFLEWEEVYKNLYYGTLKSEISKIWQSKKHILFDIDVKGGINIKKIYPNNSISIFIFVSNKELKKRLINRKSENLNKIDIRLNKAKKENKFSHLFDYILFNKNLKKSKKIVTNLISKFIHKSRSIDLNQ